LQLTHHIHTPKPSSKELILLCDNLSGPANQGAIFRLADAFGVQEIIFAQAAPDLTSSRLKKTARSTQEYIKHGTTENAVVTLDSLHAQGYTSVALEITTNSIPMEHLKLHTTKTVLVLGNEQNGVSKDVLHKVHHITHIRMLGRNSSMNVAQATGIALYELTKE